MADAIPTTDVSPRDLLAPPAPMPVAEPTDGLEGPTTSQPTPTADVPVPDVPDLGGEPYRGPYRSAAPYSDALSANLINYVQPQIEGGNKSLIASFTNALVGIDPILAPNVTEGLKYKETAPAAVNALIANTSPDQQLGILNNLAPFTTTADHYLFRDPTVEHNVSLMNRDMVADLVKDERDTAKLANGLLARGELATSDSFAYLASHGVTDSSKALAESDKMKIAFQHLEKSEMQTQRAGSIYATALTSPYVNTPIMGAVGLVDAQGVWHPKIEGFGLSTPARQQLMETFNRPEMKQHLSEQGIVSIDPVFASTTQPDTTTRPPTRPQQQASVPPWEVIEADPQYQALTPEQQAGVKRKYYDENLATQPTAQAVVQKDPKLYQPLADEFVGPPTPMGPPMPEDAGLSITQAVRQQTENWPKPAQLFMQDVAGIAETTTAFVKGATQGLLPKGERAAISQAAGDDHGVAQMVGRATADIYLGSKIPFLNTATGIVGLELTRNINMPGTAGMPLLDHATDLVTQAEQTLPFGLGPKPTSKLTNAASAALGTGLIALVAPPLLGAAGTQFEFQAKNIVAPAMEKASPAAKWAARKVSEAVSTAAEQAKPLAEKIAAATAPIRERLAQEFNPELPSTGTPPVKEGFVRFYHGGIPSEGDKVVTQDLAYAQAYAEKTPGATVRYVDVPETSPLLTKSGEEFDAMGLRYRTPYTPFQAPAAMMKGAKPLEAPVAAPVVDTVVPAAKGNKAAQIIWNVLDKKSWAGIPQSEIEQGAKEADQSVNAYLSNMAMKGVPENVVVVSEGPLEVTLTNGKVYKLSELPKALKDSILQVEKEPAKTITDIQNPILPGVQTLRGTQLAINNFLAANGQGHIRIVGNEAVKGVRIRQVGDEWRVIAKGQPTLRFASEELAKAHVNSLPVNMVSAEDSAMRQVAGQGLNPHWVMATVKNPAEGMGEMPTSQQYPTLGARVAYPVTLPKTAAMHLENTTGWPVYTKMYRPLEALKMKQEPLANQLNAQLDDILGTRGVRGSVRGTTSKWTKDQLTGYLHLMQTPMNSQAWDNVVKQYKLDNTTGGLLRDWFTRTMRIYGLDGEEFLTKVMPNIQQYGHVDAYSSYAGMPKSVSFFARDMIDGTAPIHMKGLDIYDLGKMVANQGSFNHIVGPEWENVYKQFYDPKNPMPPNVALTVDKYMRTLRGLGSNFDKSFLQAWGNFGRKLFRESGELAGGDAEQIGQQMWAQMFATQAKSYYGFRPASVTRQMMQTWLTTYPRYGAKPLMAAVKKSMNADNWAILRQAKVLNEEFASTEAANAGISTAAVQGGDNLQRAWAAFSAEHLYDKFAPLFRSGQITEKQFLKGSKLNLYDKLVQQEVLDKIAQGNTYGGKLNYMFHAAQDTQFPYAERNRIPLFTGAGGRVLGQFGNFSAGYAEYLRQIFTRGDWSDVGATLGRWIAANYGMQEAYRGIFGADASNWLWAAPLGFKGGSLWNDFVNVPYTAVTGTEQDRRTAWGRIAATPTHFIPYWSVAKDVFHGLEAKDAQGFLRALLTGMPEYKEPPPEHYGKKPRS